MASKHIEILKPADCCGCGACQQICPVSCITLQENSHGFLYPQVDVSTCIECGKCRRVCTILNPRDERIPLKCFGAQRLPDSDTDNSTTVGTFYLLAKKVIGEGGIVFGASYNETFTAVYHTFVDNVEQLSRLQKSKYIQSITGDSFKECKSFLDKGIRVLFSGTPCQIAGLKLFLNKPYDNLITVDLICHGVPSNKVWSDYLNNFIVQEIPTNSKIIAVDFRDERNGWRNSGLSVSYITSTGTNDSIFSPSSESSFFGGFYGNLFLRDTCYACPEKLGRSHSDITLGDFRALWQLRNDIDPNKPTAIILANTERGAQLVKQLNLDLVECNMPQAFTSNPELYDYNKRPAQEAMFWQRYEKEGIACLPDVLKTFQKTKWQRLILYIKQIVYLLIHWNQK